MSTSKRPERIVPARVTYSDGALYSQPFEDVYHSVEGAIDEARHVFVAGSGLSRTWGRADQVTVVEAGFGSGLNFLCSWDDLRRSGRTSRLDYVSVEKHPFNQGDLKTLLSSWPVLRELAEELVEQYPLPTPGFHRLNLGSGQVTLTLLFGDALAMFSELDAAADFFFLDGFAPSKNPEMWSSALFGQIARIARSGATVSTYSVAGAVRRGLESAGFTAEKRPGFAAKREMLVCRAPGNWQPRILPRKVVVIGAGIAGVSCARALTSRGVTVDLIDKHVSAGCGTSSNPAALVRPFLPRDYGPRDQFSWSAYAYAIRVYDQLARRQPNAWKQTGVLQLARDRRHWEKMLRALYEWALPPEFAQAVSAMRAGVLAGCKIDEPGLWFERAGFVHGPALCSALVEECGPALQCLWGVHAAAIEISGEGVRLLDGRGQTISEADRLILASGAGSQALLPTARLRLRATRGQLTRLRASSGASKVPVCREGYVTPAIDGVVYSGGTYDRVNLTDAVTDADDMKNRLRAANILTEIFGRDCEIVKPGWSGVRCASHDRLPIVGSLDEHTLLCVALGSRGFSWAPLAAEVVASSVLGVARPCEAFLNNAVSPRRLTGSHSGSQT